MGPQDGDIRIGRIEEVGPTKVTLRDSWSNSLIQVTMHLHYPVALMPARGEIWLVRRVGVDWLLEKRQDDGTETTPALTMLPGDRRLESPNDLYLTAKNVNVTGQFLVNGQPVIQSVTPVFPFIVASGTTIGTAPNINFITSGTKLIITPHFNATTNSIDITFTSL